MDCLARVSARGGPSEVGRIVLEEPIHVLGRDAFHSSTAHPTEIWHCFSRKRSGCYNSSWADSLLDGLPTKRLPGRDVQLYGVFPLSRIPESDHGVSRSFSAAAETGSSTAPPGRQGCPRPGCHLRHRHRRNHASPQVEQHRRRQPPARHHPLRRWPVFHRGWRRQGDEEPQPDLRQQRRGGAFPRAGPLAQRRSHPHLRLPLPVPRRAGSAHQRRGVDRSREQHPVPAGSARREAAGDHRDQQQPEQHARHRGPVPANRR